MVESPAWVWGYLGIMKAQREAEIDGRESEAADWSSDFMFKLVLEMREKELEGKKEEDWCPIKGEHNAVDVDLEDGAEVISESCMSAVL